MIACSIFTEMMQIRSDFKEAAHNAVMLLLPLLLYMIQTKEEPLKTHPLIPFASFSLLNHIGLDDIFAPTQRFFLCIYITRYLHNYFAFCSRRKMCACVRAFAIVCAHFCICSFDFLYALAYTYIYIYIVFLFIQIWGLFKCFIHII